MSADRRNRKDRRQQQRPFDGEDRRRGDRRELDMGVPRPSPIAHLLDLLFFRALGVWLLVHEAQAPHSDWPVLVAGGCMFFMPDWLRGKTSIPAQVLFLMIQKASRRED